LFFFFQAEDGIRDLIVTGVQTCALPIYPHHASLGGLQNQRASDDGIEHSVVGSEPEGVREAAEEIGSDEAACPVSVTGQRRPRRNRQADRRRARLEAVEAALGRAGGNHGEQDDRGGGDAAPRRSHWSPPRQSSATSTASSAPGSPPDFTRRPASQHCSSFRVRPRLDSPATDVSNASTTAGG